MSALPNKPPTQADVAALAGVSREAVSHILGRKRAHLFTENTRLTVEQAAEQLGYAPHRGAQAMRSGHSNLIVFLHMAGMSELVAKQAFHTGRLVHEAGYDYQTIDAYWWVGEGNRVTERILSLKPEGVVIAGSQQSEMDFSAFRKAGVPVVALNTQVAEVFQIRHDVCSAVKDLTVAAYACGKTSPMLVLQEALPENSVWQTSERKNGFLAALAEVGALAPQEILLREMNELPPLQGPAIAYVDCREHVYFSVYEPGRRAAQLIAGAADALIATNDTMAIGMLTHYMRKNVSLPQEVAISGFDNISATTQGGVFLTSVEHPTEEMCQAAMEVLLKQIQDKQHAVGQMTFPCEIVWRESMPMPPTQSPENSLRSPRKSSQRTHNALGFTLIELLAVIAVIAILASLLMGSVQTMSGKAKEVSCLANLRAIGLAAHSYAAEHKGDWPYYLYSYDPPQPKNVADNGGFLSTNAICINKWNGLGKLYSGGYLSDYHAFFCPAATDTNDNKKKDLYKWDSESGTGWIGANYAQRGYKQFSYQFQYTEGRNQVKAAEVSKSAMVSCFFLRSPTMDGGKILYHKKSYPVLFGDGSVSIIKNPEDILPVKNPPVVWGISATQNKVWGYFDQNR